jgi:hypothetical protein
MQLANYYSKIKKARLCAKLTQGIQRVEIVKFERRESFVQAE